ncbi:hypothetical protein [Hugenholtzia roseola]|uniref:hypothetical protein n=1 Tax=Hugenholtzia roseola TaxID=1002 RepID=UPI00047E7CDE|nr:hypothetical protein [Hugenholtzia roseola]
MAKKSGYSLLKRLALFFFVLVPLFLTAVFYLLSGSFFDAPHHNPLTAQWKTYAPQTVANTTEQHAEASIALLNQGLTDEKEQQLIQYFQHIAAQSKMNDFLSYLQRKDFQGRNALELFILRFDEHIYQRGLSVEFLWKSTLAATTNLIPQPKQNFPQKNHTRLVELLAAICLDSTLQTSHFEAVLTYNAHAWAWHNNRDNSRYQFEESYQMEDICLTQRTLLQMLPFLFEKSTQVSPQIWKRIDRLLEEPKCKRKGGYIDYAKEREKIKEILE